MAAPIELRADYDAEALRSLARLSGDANQARRLLALASIYDGGSRTDAAKLGAVDLQTIRDWVIRFNERGPEGLIDRKSSGPEPKLNGAQRQALAEIVERGPIPAVHGVVRWRLVDLTGWVFEEFGVSLSESAMSRTLSALGFAKLSARPRHYAQNELLAEDFKKDFLPSWRRSGPSSRPAPR